MDIDRANPRQPGTISNDILLSPMFEGLGAGIIVFFFPKCIKLIDSEG